MAEKQTTDAEHALRLMQAALELLDKLEVALDATAHLDLAIHRLTTALGSRRAGDQEALD